MSKLSVVLLFSALFLSGCSSGEIPEPVRCLDLERYCGKWYEVARLPNWFEAGMTNVSAEYRLAGAGKIKVVNRGWKDGKLEEVTGWARRMDDDNTGALEVSFFRPFYSPYIVIKIAPDYSYSVVSGSGMDFLWILSRMPELPENVLAEILLFLRQRGYDTERLEFSGE